MIVFEGPIKRIFWILATIGAVIGLGYNLWMVTTTFVDRPVSVGIAIQHANDIEFPAITICNMSPVKKSAATQMNVPQTQRRRKRSTGEMNSGKTNSGEMNSGEMNSGKMNSDEMNSGEMNSGEMNSGKTNSGEMNSGEMNSGEMNSGKTNSVEMNSGEMNSGKMNSDEMS